MTRIEKSVSDSLQVQQPVTQKPDGRLSVATNPIEVDSRKLTASLDGLSTCNLPLVKQSNISDKIHEIEKLKQEIKKFLIFEKISDTSTWNCEDLYNDDLKYYRLQLEYFNLLKEITTVQPNYEGMSPDDIVYLNKIILSLRKELLRVFPKQNEIVSVEPYLIMHDTGENFFKELCKNVTKANGSLSINIDDWNPDQKILGHNRVGYEANETIRNNFSTFDMFSNLFNWMLYDYQFKRLPLTDRDYIVYRGFATDSKTMQDIIQNKKEGDIVVPDSAYSYYSNDEETSSLYIKNKGRYTKNKYYIKTYVPKGSKISINCNAQEVAPPEALLPRNAKYRLIYKKDISDKYNENNEKIYELGLEYIPEEIPDVIDSLSEIFKQDNIIFEDKMLFIKYYLKLYAQNGNIWINKDKLLKLLQNTSEQLSSDKELCLLNQYYEIINNSVIPSKAYDKIKNL